MLYHDSFSLRLPIKCIDLDNTNGQLKLEGWLHDVLIFMTLYRGRHYFIGYFREEAPFYWVRLAGGWSSFFIYVQDYAGGWLEFVFMDNVLLGGLVILIKLFYWCGLNSNETK